MDFFAVFHNSSPLAFPCYSWYSDKDNKKAKTLCHRRERIYAMRIWAKIFTDNRMKRDMVVVSNDPQLTRTKKIFSALEEVCMTFDLSIPIWLDANISDFKRAAKTRFTQDSFVDHIDFDYLEFQIIEED